MSEKLMSKEELREKIFGIIGDYVNGRVNTGLSMSMVAGTVDRMTDHVCQVVEETTEDVLEARSSLDAMLRLMHRSIEVEMKRKESMPRAFGGDK